MVDFDLLARQRCAKPLPLPVREWAEAVEGLDLYERGALISLLFTMWNRPSGCIPPFKARLAIGAGVDINTWRRHLDARLTPLFERVPGGYSHEMILAAIRADEMAAIIRDELDYARKNI